MHADPYETVTFLVGGHVDGEGTWVWSTGGEVGEADTCPGDHYSGACLGITWNQQLGCRSGWRQSSFLPSHHVYHGAIFAGSP